MCERRSSLGLGRCCASILWQNRRRTQCHQIQSRNSGTSLAQTWHQQWRSGRRYRKLWFCRLLGSKYRQVYRGGGIPHQQEKRQQKNILSAVLSRRRRWPYSRVDVAGWRHAWLLSTDETSRWQKHNHAVGLVSLYQGHVGSWIRKQSHRRFCQLVAQCLPRLYQRSKRIHVCTWHQHWICQHTRSWLATKIPRTLWHARCPWYYSFCQHAEHWPRVSQWLQQWRRSRRHRNWLWPRQGWILQGLSCESGSYRRKWSWHAYITQHPCLGCVWL